MAAQEDGEWDVEKGPKPGPSVPVVVAPPSKMDARHSPAAAAAGEAHDDDGLGPKIPHYIWVSLQLLLTAVVCCPLLAFALTSSDSTGMAVRALVILPVVAGVFFILHVKCRRPRKEKAADMLKGLARCVGR